MNAIDKYDMESLWFTDFAGEPEKCWFAAGNINGLFEADLITGEAFFLGRFKKEKSWKKMLYQCCVKFGNKILFAPALASSIAIYDTENGSLKEILLPQELHVANTRFLSIVQYENVCFLICAVKPVIVCVDLLDDSVFYDFQILDRKMALEYEKALQGALWWERDIIKKEKYFIIISYKLGIYVKYNIERRITEQVCYFKSFTTSGVAAVNDDSCTYLIEKNRIFYEKNHIKKEFIIDEKECQTFNRFVKSYLVDNCYYIFTDTNLIIRINHIYSKIEYFKIPEYNVPFHVEGCWYDFFRCIKRYERGFCFLQVKGNILHIYNNQLKELIKQRMLPSNKSMFELCYERDYMNDIVTENDKFAFLNCNYFLQFINFETEKNKYMKEKMDIGDTVHFLIKKGC